MLLYVALIFYLTSNKNRIEKIKGNVAIRWLIAGHSSDGRAIDCRSIGPVFDSQCPDLT